MDQISLFDPRDPFTGMHWKRFAQNIILNTDIDKNSQMLESY